MKRVIFLFVLIMGLFINLDTVSASDYWPQGDATIKIDGEYIRKDRDTINNDAVKGATYDKTTNTLIFDNVSINELRVEDMGESFKLKLIGVNTIKRIFVDGDIVSSNFDIINTTYLHIIGDGTLKIRREIGYNDAIEVWNGRLIIDNTVNVIIDKEEGFDNDPLIKVTSMSKSISHALYLEGREAIEGTTEFFRDINTGIAFATVRFDEKLNYKKIYTKDSKKYAVEHYDGDEYKIYLSNIKQYTYNGKTFNYVDLLDDYDYYTLDELRKEGYVENNDSYDVYQFHVEYLHEMFDSIGNWYYVDNNDNVFKYTGEVIIFNGEYPYVIPDNTVDASELERKVYKHFINEDVFISKFKTYNAVEGNNQEYIIGSEGLSFRFDAPYSVFSDSGKVFIDEEEITNYTSKKGSTIINLSGDYLDTLSLGEHVLSIEYNDGRTSSVLFTISKPTENTVTNPATGDNIMIYISLLLFSLFILKNKKILV